MSRARIRVAQVIGSLRYGGAEMQVVRILNGLDPASFERHLVTFDDPGPEVVAGLDAGVGWHALGSTRLGSAERVVRLARWFRRLRPDVVQTHMYHANLLGAVAARWAGVPVVIATEHGQNPWKRPVHHWIERHLVAPRVDLRVAVSRDIAERRIRAGSVRPEGIRVIPPCVPLFPDPPRPRSRPRPRVGAVGRLIPVKGYAVLLDAVARVLARGVDAELALVGDGPARADLEAHAARLGLTDRVRFLGASGDVPSLLRDFDVFALSSFSEGVPVALLEAMSMGLPAVATRVGGVPEVLAENTEGLVVPPGDAVALAEALARLLGDRALRERLGQAARARVERSFASEAICSRYQALYRELLASRPASAPPPPPR